MGWRGKPLDASSLIHSRRYCAGVVAGSVAGGAGTAGAASGCVAGVCGLVLVVSPNVVVSVVGAVAVPGAVAGDGSVVGTDVGAVVGLTSKVDETAGVRLSSSGSGDGS